MHEKTEITVLGFWIYILTDCVLFAALFATYAVLRGETYGAASIAQIVNLPYITAETLLLLTSSFTAGLALLAAYRNDQRLTLAGLALTFLLGASFLGLEWTEFGRLILSGNGPSHSAFLSAYFTLVGTHGLHVALGSLWMLILGIYLYRRGLTESNMRKLICFSLFWHFLDIVWIFIFTFVYLFGAV